MDLGIFIITYNRASNLDTTLGYITNSIFSSYPITVLNNRSEDNTLEVCESYKDKIPGLKVITHHANIGGDANYLRAIEYSDKKYTWVLCDDDVLDLSEFDDVAAIIDEGKVDLIHLGGHKTNWRWGGKTYIPKDLLKLEYRYFKFGSFIPGSIVKTKSFKDNVMVKAYRNITNAYAQMPFQFYVFENDLEIYISKKQHTFFSALGSPHYSMEEFFLWWMNTCRQLKDKEYVKVAFFDQFVDEVDKDTFMSDLFFLYQKNVDYRDNIRNLIRYFSSEDKKKFNKLSSSFDKKMAVKEFIGEDFYFKLKTVFKPKAD